MVVCKMITKDGDNYIRVRDFIILLYEAKDKAVSTVYQQAYDSVIAVLKKEDKDGNFYSNKPG